MQSIYCKKKFKKIKIKIIKKYMLHKKNICFKKSLACYSKDKLKNTKSKYICF